jgi:N-acetyl-anhydromuramyl-L-alanine amidase AmpD
MVEVEKYGNFKSIGKNKKKYQIILIHTSRNVENYLQSLKYRYNGKYKKIPNYLVTKNGKVLQLLNNNEYSEIFSNGNVNKNSIVICLENLGWLQKEPLKDYYVNWIGDIYKGKAFEKKWREYFFWDPYTEEQINSTVELIKNIFDEMEIKKNIIGHNTKINGVEKYEGVTTRSNYDSIFTDVSPSFSFEEFIKKVDNEQFT